MRGGRAAALPGERADGAEPVRFGGWADYGEWADHDFRDRSPFEEPGRGGGRPVVVEALTEVTPIRVLAETEGESGTRRSCRIAPAADYEDGIRFEAGDLTLDLDRTAPLIRPYVRSGGRSESSHELEFETMIAAARPYATLPQREMSQDERLVCRTCAVPQSVAEIAVAIEAPLGLARTIISDGIDKGYLRVHSISGPTAGGLPSLELLRRLYAGLARLI
ncbi:MULTISPECIES: DUF742 domain-containing protein [unclassified Crossiella]|uniref:DUF742 domain-containing protein n=1 Tax=unclassified Crossiella TaxID=2620835 RepID=UPI001FFEEAB9|nr:MULTISPECIES: DUF742 domain-containing protein [unclassified Crossiella]MCK2244250.1 DUF742 domain-containing protein [Crossiella sp. S99.2]MCK2258054.1 DUF742 domain-containing protein [Crossiella sp. S99.1]